MMPVTINQQAVPIVSARRYAELGWHVMPLWWIESTTDQDTGEIRYRCACGEDCASPGKHPIARLAPAGQHSATTEQEMIGRWWADSPRANIAIVLAPSNLVAIDIDPRNGGDQTIVEIEARYGRLDTDVIQLTGGGGEHRVFAVPSGQAVNLPGKLGPGVDVKHHGYIVAEPSGHISGGKYQWEASCDPLEGQVPTPLPDWLRSIRPDAPAEQDGARALPPADVLELQSALAVIDPDPRDAWLQVGMALHATGAGAQAYGLWVDWSRASSKFDPREQLKIWRSFKRDGAEGVTRATIFARAQSVGWVNPRAKQPTQSTQPTQQPPRSLPLEFADDWPQEVAAIPQMVEDVLTTGALSVVYGESNSGKTYMVLDMACSVARGVPWIGQRTVQGAVLYIAGEGAQSVRARVAAYRQWHSITHLPLAVIPTACNLLDQAGDTAGVIEAAHVAAQRLHQPVTLIVVDTLARAMGAGNENAAEDMGALVAHADQIRAQTGAHVLFIHHSGKDASKGARGSTVLRGAVDTEIEVTGDDSNFHLATITKQRDLASKGFSVTAEFIPVTVGIDQWGKDISVCVLRKSDNRPVVQINIPTGDKALLLSVCVDGQEWEIVRTAFYRLPELAIRESESRKKAFMRATRWLIDNQFIILENGRCAVLRAKTEGGERHDNSPGNRDIPGHVPDMSPRNYPSTGDILPCPPFQGGRKCPGELSRSDATKCRRV